MRPSRREKREKGYLRTLLVNLLLELVLDKVVREVRILLREHLSGRVLEGVDTRLKLSEVLNGDLTLDEKKKKNELGFSRRDIARHSPRARLSQRERKLPSRQRRCEP